MSLQHKIDCYNTMQNCSATSQSIYLVVPVNIKNRDSRTQQ